MKDFLLQVFTWWNGQTMGTRFHTWRHGEKVGEDALGNVYYQSEGGKRRWVIYNGEAEASAIPSGWHGWMHKRTDTPPSSETYVAREWELPHKQNLTGTAAAYHPKGSMLRPGEETDHEPDYQAWAP